MHILYIHTHTDLISNDEVEELMAYNVEWPICNYVPESRRYIHRQRQLMQKSTPPTIEEMLSLLDGWNKYPNISIDGMNGVGKSSLVSNLNRRYVKVNLIDPDVTSGADYNFQPMKSMQYLMAAINMNVENSVWDRCCYANLIFYFVHHLMSHYRAKLIPRDSNVVYSVLNTMAIDINLPNIITFIKSIYNIPTLFLVCSNIKMIGNALKNRKTINDIYNAKEYNYQMAQYHAYCYFARILNYPVIDIMDFFRQHYTLGDMQQAIAIKIDVPRTETQQLQSQQQQPQPQPQPFDVEGFEASRNLNETMRTLNSERLLFFDFSNK